MTHNKQNKPDCIYSIFNYFQLLQIRTETKARISEDVLGKAAFVTSCQARTCCSEVCEEHERNAHGQSEEVVGAEQQQRSEHLSPRAVQHTLTSRL